MCHWRSIAARARAQQLDLHLLDEPVPTSAICANLLCIRGTKRSSMYLIN
jgi:hypothetical protein